MGQTKTPELGEREKQLLEATRAFLRATESGDPAFLEDARFKLMLLLRSYEPGG
jgi:hypothetical protein